MEVIKLYLKDEGFMEHNNYNCHPKWFKLGKHLLKLYINPNQNNLYMIKRSYDRIASFYEDTGTSDYWVLSDEMLDRLSPKKGMKALDLFCGTGYVTERIAKRTEMPVMGVDISKNMLDIAQQKGNENCEYINCEVLDYLKKQHSKSFDIVTCAWGLGYSKPYQILKEINRILKDNGKIGIIENTVLTAYEITLAAILALAEKPDIISNFPLYRFPLSIYGLIIKMWFSGFHIQESWKGIITYYEQSGKELVQKLRNTSVVAGYEYAINKNSREEYFQRMASILDYRYRKKHVIPIINRYIGAIGIK